MMLSCWIDLLTVWSVLDLLVRPLYVVGHRVGVVRAESSFVTAACLIANNNNGNVLFHPINQYCIRCCML